MKARYTRHTRLSGGSAPTEIWEQAREFKPRAVFCSSPIRVLWFSHLVQSVWMASSFRSVHHYKTHGGQHLYDVSDFFPVSKLITDDKK